jgi:hypothetical protein
MCRPRHPRESPPSEAREPHPPAARHVAAHANPGLRFRGRLVVLRRPRRRLLPGLHLRPRDVRVLHPLAEPRGARRPLRRHRLPARDHVRRVLPRPAVGDDEPSRGLAAKAAPSPDPAGGASRLLVAHRGRDPAASRIPRADRRGHRRRFVSRSHPRDPAPGPPRPSHSARRGAHDVSSGRADRPPRVGLGRRPGARLLGVLPPLPPQPSGNARVPDPPRGADRPPLAARLGRARRDLCRRFRFLTQPLVRGPRAASSVRHDFSLHAPLEPDHRGRGRSANRKADVKAQKGARVRARRPGRLDRNPAPRPAEDPRGPHGPVDARADDGLPRLLALPSRDPDQPIRPAETPS